MMSDSMEQQHPATDSASSYSSSSSCSNFDVVAGLEHDDDDDEDNEEQDDTQTQDQDEVDVHEEAEQEEEGEVITPLQEELDVTMDAYSSRRPLLSSSFHAPENEEEEEAGAVDVANKQDCAVDQDPPTTPPRAKASLIHADEKENVSLNIPKKEDTETLTKKNLASAAAQAQSHGLSHPYQPAPRTPTLDYAESTITSLVTVPLSQEEDDHGGMGTTGYGRTQGGPAAIHALHQPENRRPSQFFRRTNPAPSPRATKGPMEVQPLQRDKGLMQDAKWNTPTLDASSTPKKSLPATHFKDDTCLKSTQSQEPHTKPCKKSSPPRSPLRRAALSCFSPRLTDTPPRKPHAQTRPLSMGLKRNWSHDEGVKSDMLVSSSYHPPPSPGVRTGVRRVWNRTRQGRGSWRQQGLYQSHSWDPVKAAVHREVHTQTHTHIHMHNTTATTNTPNKSPKTKPDTSWHAFPPFPHTREALEEQKNRGGIRMISSTSSEYGSSSGSSSGVSPSRVMRSATAGGDGLSGMAPSRSGTVLLESPMRMDMDQKDALTSKCHMDMEREDALDILSCLVQRSLGFEAVAPATTLKAKLFKDALAGEATQEDRRHLKMEATRTGLEGSHKMDGDEIQETVEAHLEKEGAFAKTPSKENSSRQELNDKQRNHHCSPKEITSVMDHLRILSQQDKDQQDAQGNVQAQAHADPHAPSHELQLQVLDELLLSHTYAMEMKRAAMSAYAWLKAIGRDPRGASSDAGGAGRSSKRTSVESQRFSEDVAEGFPRSWRPPDAAHSQQRGKNAEDLLDGKSNLKTTPASVKEDPNAGTQDAVPNSTFSIAEMQQMMLDSEEVLRQKEHQILVLDQELCKCRAEIGRLKSAARAEVLFTSPNRSILDDDSDFDMSSSVGGGTGDNASATLETALGDITPVPEHRDDDGNALKSEDDEDENKDGEGAAGLKEGREALRSHHHGAIHKVDSILSPASSATEEEIENANPNVSNSSMSLSRRQQRQIARLKADLRVANEKIEKLLCSGMVDNTSFRLDQNFNKNENTQDSEASNHIKESTKESRSPGKKPRDAGKQNEHADERLINVRMLDGENFITDWDDLAPPLPPPPDHDLRAPIVRALLAQWSQDEKMHESLLSWMDSMLEKNTDPDSVPPLTLTSLDHQVRDGFAMHVLPLLLRRSDVRVDVTTRAHRRTFYDIAVSVSRSVGGEQLQHRGGLSGQKNTHDGNIPKKSISSKNASGDSDWRESNGSGSTTNSAHMMAFKASSGNSLSTTEGKKEDEEEGFIHQKPLGTSGMSAADFGRYGRMGSDHFFPDGREPMNTSSTMTSPSHAGASSVANSSITIHTSNRALIPNLATIGSGITPTSSNSQSHSESGGGSAHFSGAGGQKESNLDNAASAAAEGSQETWNSGSRPADDFSVGSSITGTSSLRTPPRDTEERSVFMKALGGAIGGFLSRRGGGSGGSSSAGKIKNTNNDGHSTNSMNSLKSSPPRRSWSYDDGDMDSSWNDSPPRRNAAAVLAQQQQQLSSISSSPSRLGQTEHHYVGRAASSEGGASVVDPQQQQPYHRVVSAPPGRIGVTFVQFRGHAMVSDVAPESPLQGFVFPSDILIAIDEVPVSGLRVREIVKLLTARKDRQQRSLRLVSTHAMTELTRGSGPGGGGAG